MEVFRTAIALIVRSMVLSAQSAGQQRLLFLQRGIAAGETAGELIRLRDENRRLRSELRMFKDRFGDAPARKRYTPLQRLRILWHIAYYGIPRNQVPLSTAREAGLTSRRQPEGGDPGVREEPSLDSTREGLGGAIRSLPDFPAMNQRWNCPADGRVSPPVVVVLREVIEELA